MAKSSNSQPKKSKKVKPPPQPNFDMSEDDVYVEGLKHAQVYYRWKEYLAKLQLYYDRKFQEAENKLAPVRDSIRSDLVAERGRAALTEKSVNDSLRTRKEARQLLEVLRLIKRKLILTEAVMASLEVKSDMIKSLLYAKGRSDLNGL